MSKKRDLILVLNKSFFPLRTESMQQTFVNMSKGTYLGLDLEYDTNEDGSYNFDKMSSMAIVRNWKEWCALPVRSCDESIRTVKGPIRVPSVVVCSAFNKIKFPRVQFPNSHNIFKRDNNTCGYTGVKLPPDKRSMDHIIPKSRGGEDTWENLITCDRELNGWKGNRLNSECGLKLLVKPTAPKNGLVFDILRDEWRTFVGSLAA